MTDLCVIKYCNLLMKFIIFLKCSELEKEKLKLLNTVSFVERWLVYRVFLTFTATIDIIVQDLTHKLSGNKDTFHLHSCKSNLATRDYDQCSTNKYKCLQCFVYVFSFGTWCLQGVTKHVASVYLHRALHSRFFFRNQT